ncbi:MAG TPA: GGDEF domain-containing protein [Candidatus Limnocylindria bacterium]|nr:GGDEF domain-containing protein [Candidatus Limnocylindria bacterium]
MGKPERRRGDPSPRRASGRIAVLLTVVEAVLVGIFAVTVFNSAVFTEDSGAAGLGACAGVLAMGVIARRRLPDLEPLPGLDLDELSARIGTRIVEIAPDAEPRPAPAALTQLSDLSLFAVVGVPKFAAARANGWRCAVVVLSVDSWTRFDAPRDARSLPLEEIAQAVRANVRSYDIAARYGEDEFILFLDRCDRFEAQRIVQRLAYAVQEIVSPAGQLGISAGVAMYPDCDGELHGLIQRADVLLREIKSQGRSEIRLVAPDLAPGMVPQPGLA